jgi:ZIP family zinc transporter
VLHALAIAALAVSSLIVGAALALGVKLPKRTVGLLLAFGAGALVSSVSFELADEAINQSGVWLFGAGLALGALTFYAGDRRLEGDRRPHRTGDSNGAVLALGALLDGIPEQTALGISLAGGAKANVALIAAIFVSNLPEAVGSAAALRANGSTAGRILGLWGLVAAVGVLATLLGYGLLDGVSSELRGTVNAFAAGAVLCMLIDSMIPEARKDGGRVAGLATMLGFAVAVALSQA